MQAQLQNPSYRHPRMGVLPGQYYLAESGLMYNMHRTYDKDTGRYIESDPLGLLGGMNTYSYAYDNPLRWMDDNGKSPHLPSTGTHVPGSCGSIDNPPSSAVPQASLPPGSKGPIKKAVCGDLKECNQKCQCYLDTSLALCGPNVSCIMKAKRDSESCLLNCS
jgi:RHS repeat-associated protein